MNASSRAPVAIATAAVVAVLALSACGIGSSDAVEEMEPDELAALDQTTTTSSTTTTVEAVPTTEPEGTSADSVDSVPPHSGVVESSDVTVTTALPTSSTDPTREVMLYFVDGSQLVAVDVDVPASDALRRQLDALGLGPPAEDFEHGLRTAVPAGLIIGLEIRGDRVTVNFDGEIVNRVEAPDQLHMVAQIVLTLTGDMGYDEVRFTTDGEPMRVFRDDNSLSEPGQMLTRDDYAALLVDGQRSGS